MNSGISNKITSVVKAYLPQSRVLMFGSRVRGESSASSDYDILIITPDNISPGDKMSLITKIHKALVYALDAPVDVLLNSEDEVKRKMNLPGHVVRWALKEAIEL